MKRESIGFKERKSLLVALAGCDSAADPDFNVSPEILLNCLGYKSERTVARANNDAAAFVKFFHSPKIGSESEKRFVSAAKSARVIFQCTASEIQQETDSGKGFEKGNIQSFLFAAVDLVGRGYSTGEYAEFARDINKRFRMPALVLIRAKNARGANCITLTFVNRRANKNTPSLDVLERVSVLREINCISPHRGDLDVLMGLSLKARMNWIDLKRKSRDFDGLLAALLNGLDINTIERRLCRKLGDFAARCVNRKVPGIKMPENLRNERKMKEWFDRLIVRIVFVRVLGAMGLVAEELFEYEAIKPFLKKRRGVTASYYRVFLQNLFFATLNAPIGDRRFARDGENAYRNFSLYRYADEIADGKVDDFINLLGQTPFVNGGLFHCLDDKDNGNREDYFSGLCDKLLSIPDDLFFGEGGLFSILDRYKFTVGENTPIDQEVALSLGFLGQVFESLHVAGDARSQRIARKRPGAFYTNPEIADYVMIESLIEHLSTKVRVSKSSVRNLLDGAAVNRETRSDDIPSLVRAISTIKIFDPVVGSGAFLMSALDNMTLALSKIDPDNKLWKDMQVERINAVGLLNEASADMLDVRLKEVDEIFERYSPNYVRKLFLIQNSIFGVDVQPFACEITKLGFFTSLAIEQERNADPEDNFGIRPLPDLEAHFITADALISMGGKGTPLFESGDTAILVNQMKSIRKCFLGERGYAEKRKLRDEYTDRRCELLSVLTARPFGGAESLKIARWNPWDRNVAAEWFDAEYMFGVEGGFDIVVGNPPRNMLNERDEQAARYLDEIRATLGFFAHGMGGVHRAFVERSLMDFTAHGGILSFVVPSTMLAGKGAAGIRNMFMQHSGMNFVVELPERARGARNADDTTAVFSACKGNVTEKFPLTVRADAHTLPPKVFTMVTLLEMQKSLCGAVLHPVLKKRAMAKLSSNLTQASLVYKR